MLIKYTKTHPNAKFPTYAHPGDAGADVYCVEDFEIVPGLPLLVMTGLKFEIEHGYELQVRSKSGLALKGVIVLNSPGTIDCGYRGELGVILKNVNPMDSQSKVSFKAGDKIAQLVIAPVVRAEYCLSDGYANTKSDRGVGGFGSTGS